MILRFFSQLDSLYSQILIKTGQKKAEPNRCIGPYIRVDPNRTNFNHLTQQYTVIANPIPSRTYSIQSTEL
jgi:hypothetical protein